MGVAGGRVERSAKTVGVLRKEGKSGVAARSSRADSSGGAEGVSGRIGSSDSGSRESNSADNAFSASASVTSLPTSSSTGSPPTGPGIGFLPSRNAFAISDAFHLEYLILSETCKAIVVSLIPAERR